MKEVSREYQYKINERSIEIMQDKNIFINVLERRNRLITLAQEIITEEDTSQSLLNNNVK